MALMTMCFIDGLLRKYNGAHQEVVSLEKL